MQLVTKLEDSPYIYTSLIGLQTESNDMRGKGKTEQMEKMKTRDKLCRMLQSGLTFVIS